MAQTGQDQDLAATHPSTMLVSPKSAEDGAGPQDGGGVADGHVPHHNRIQAPMPIQSRVMPCPHSDHDLPLQVSPRLY